MPNDTAGKDVSPVPLSVPGSAVTTGTVVIGRFALGVYTTGPSTAANRPKW